MTEIQDRTPVIVGIGEMTERAKNLGPQIEPLEMMATVLRMAADDACVPLEQIDSLSVIYPMSWPYEDAAGRLVARAGLRPRHTACSEPSGEAPVNALHKAALRIARGESEIAVIVGAEAQYSVIAAERTGAALPWSEPDRVTQPQLGTSYLDPMLVRLGLAVPLSVYPLFENAAQAAWGQSPRAAIAETADIWSRLSEVAATNPYAWSRESRTPADIATPSEENRLLMWPYTKMIVANPMVNMGAAVLLTSRGRARAAGIPEDRLICVVDGASAAEPRDYLHRDQFARCYAMEAVLEAMRANVGDLSRLDLIELYSCFPVVPKMGRRALGLPEDAVLTATGGLSYFGAPSSNYMTHAMNAVTRTLRRSDSRTALLYGQGGYFTKHHAILLSNDPDAAKRLDDDYSVQSVADARRGPAPPLLRDYAGDAVIETFTVFYDRGVSMRGAVIARTPQGARLICQVEKGDGASLAALTDLDRTAVGRAGRVKPTPDGMLTWRLGEEMGSESVSP